jgi:predicted dehydrogenase
MIKACLIGVSGFAEVHLRDLLRQQGLGRLELVAVAVLDRERALPACAALEAFGCRIFGDYQTMLAALGSEADICVVPTGIHLHAPMTIDALRAGMKVFVEKPAAPTIQEVRAMQAAEAETGRRVAVGYQAMYGPDTMVMKRAILDGELGELRSIKAMALWPRGVAYYGRNDWAGRLRSGGRWVLDSPINNAFAHQLNTMCFLAGQEPNRSARIDSVEAELYRAYPIEGADTCCLRVITGSSTPLLILATHACQQAVDPQIVVTGTRGVMTWDYHRSLTIEIGGKPPRVLPATPEFPRDYVYDALLEWLRDPDVFVCSLEVAAAQTICVNGAHLSSSVLPVPDEHLSRSAGQTVISGIEALFAQCFERERLPSELGAPWARSGEVVSTRELSFFPGPRVANQAE